MCPSTLDQRLEHRIPNPRSGSGAAGNGGIEGGQMMAVKMADQVGRAEANMVAQLLH
jgi:hypothetical protein